MKRGHLVVLLLVVFALFATKIHAQTVSVAGKPIPVAGTQPVLNLSHEFAALRHAMRAQLPSATLSVYYVNGLVSLRSLPMTYARIERR